jgi:hypothetical protein
MAAEIEERLRSGKHGEFRSSARYHGSKYAEARLRAFAVRLVPAVIRGEVGRTSISALARDFGVSRALVRTLLEQPDLPTRLNFLAESLIGVQTAELAREVMELGGPRTIVWVRTQPTCPIVGMHASYGGRAAFGLVEGRASGTFDTMYATFASMAQEGREQSINLGGLVKGLEQDRLAFEADSTAMTYLSPLQRISLSNPTKAMFLHAGAVDAAARPEIPPELDARVFVFMKGRFEGFEESEWLASPSNTVSIVSEPGYQKIARLALGDDVDLVVEAEGDSPEEGLERRHAYISKDRHVFDNERVRKLIDEGLPYKLDRYLIAEHRGIVLLLLPGELRARGRDDVDAGQALLRMNQDDELRWFSLLNRADGRRAWLGDEADRQRRLNSLAEAFALLEACDSTAGHARRQQFEALSLFDVSSSDPNSRQNVWRLASAARQSRLPDAPLGAVLSP